MKNLLLLLLLTSETVFSQTKIDTINKKIFINEVINMKGTSKELKDKAFEWVAKTYNNSNHVVKLNTDDKIIAKGSFEGKIISQYSGDTTRKNIDYTLQIDFKDNKYRFQINGVLFDDWFFYLMDKNGFKKFMIIQYSRIKGNIGKKMIKKLDKEEYISKYYNLSKNSSVSEVKSIESHLNAIYKSLETHMSTEDEW